jgi:hypothetical protein
MIKIDIHQHLWTEPFVQALAERGELPSFAANTG